MTQHHDVTPPASDMPEDASTPNRLPPATELQRTFGFLLSDSARLARRAFDRRAAELGLTRAQWQVLAHLARSEGVNQARLADTLEIQPITLVRLLDRLQDSGWIERRLDPADRRARTLHLTDKAHPVLARMYALGAEVRELALQGIDADRRELLLDALVQIRQNLAQREEVPAAPPTRRRHG